MLLLLTILFALATVALAVVLAVTVLKGDSDDDKTGMSISYLLFQKCISLAFISDV